MAELVTSLRSTEAPSRSGRRWLPNVSERGFLTIWMLSDVAIVGATGVLAGWLHYGAADLSGPRGLAVVLAMVISWVAFKYVGLHELETAARPLTQLRRGASAVLLTALAIGAIGYATKTGAEISRVWVGLWLLWAILAFTATRTLVANAFERLQAAGTFARRHAVFAAAENLPRLEAMLTRWTSFMPVSHSVEAIFLDRPLAADGHFPWRHLVAGTFNDFGAWRGRDFIDAAVVLMPPDNHDKLEPLMERLGVVAVDVDLIAGELDEVWARRKVTKVAGLPAVRIMTRPLEPEQRFVKRIEDIAIASLALIALSPVMALVAMAVKLDSDGPVLFRQPRHGFNNRTFPMLKFRSMRHATIAPTTVAQATRNDPRVTRVGAILRRTSLDELPQLINVLRGEMSIVGPRPHAVTHNDHFAQRIRSYLARHRVKPGITGWAQVNGFRGETQTDEKMRKRVEHDLFYVDHWSLGFDLKIVLLTARCLIHPNAY